MQKLSSSKTGATLAREYSASPPAEKQSMVSPTQSTTGGGKARTAPFTNEEMNIALDIIPDMLVYTLDHSCSHGLGGTNLRCN